MSGKHRKSGKAQSAVDWAAKRHSAFLVVGHCIYEISLGGAAIVIFEWFRPIATHTEAIAEIVRNVRI